MKKKIVDIRAVLQGLVIFKKEKCPLYKATVRVCNNSLESMHIIKERNGMTKVKVRNVGSLRNGVRCSGVHIHLTGTKSLW